MLKPHGLRVADDAEDFRMGPADPPFEVVHKVMHGRDIPCCVDVTVIIHHEP